MSSLVTTTGTSATSLATVVSDIIASVTTPQSTTQTIVESSSYTSIAAGASGVSPSSSLTLDGDLSNKATQQYKTVYVTKTAEPTSHATPSALPIGAIVGIAVGGVAVLALIIGLVYIILRRRRRKVLESSEVPRTRTSGSQSTVVGKRSEGDMSELYGTRDQPIFEAHGKVVYEMEASMPELDGRSFSLGSEQGLKPAATAATRHIMSRGRPVGRDKG